MKKNLRTPILLAKDAPSITARTIIGFNPRLLQGELPEPFRLEYTGEKHLMTIASTGSGKSTACIVPNLLIYRDPVVVLDPKGELYHVTARERRRMGHRVVLLDPFLMIETKRKRDGLNMFEFIQRSADPFLECQSLAHHLSGKGFANDPYWDDNARSLLSGIMYYVCLYNKPEERNLRAVYSLLTTDDLDYKIAVILDTNKDLPREIRECFIAYLNAPSDKTRPCILSTAQSYLHLYASKSVMESLDETTFCLNDFIKGKPVDIYLVFPEDKLKSHAKLFVQWLIILMRSITTRKRMVSTNTLFIIDEAATIGRNEYIANFLTICRGYNARLWLFFQDLQQVQNCYATEYKTIINNCGVFQAFEPETYHAAIDLKSITNIGPEITRRLGDERQIVLTKNMEYLGCKKVNYLTDPEFAGKWDINPYYRLR